jgi:hypothetical protein
MTRRGCVCKVPLLDSKRNLRFNETLSRYASPGGRRRRRRTGEREPGRRVARRGVERGESHDWVGNRQGSVPLDGGTEG